MCRAFLLLGGGKLAYKVLLNYTVNSYENRNSDGFFIKIDNKTNRTLDFAKYIDFIVKNENAIKESKLIAGHLRLATNKVCKDNIHGWGFKYSGYTFNCYHNGVNSIKNRKNSNDSFDFFEAVFERAKRKKLINALREEIEERGSGAYFIVNDKYIILASVNHEINVHLLNNQLLCINSNDDIHNIKQTVTIIRNIKKFGFQFRKKHNISFDEKISSDGLYTFNDKIVILAYNDKKKYYEKIKEVSVRRRHDIVIVRRGNLIKYYENEIYK